MLKLIFYFIIGYIIYSLFKLVRVYLKAKKNILKHGIRTERGTYEKDISDEAIIIEEKRMEK